MLNFYENLPVGVLPIPDSREYNLSTVNQLLEEALEENLRNKPEILQDIYVRGSRYLQRCSTEYQREIVKKEMLRYILIDPSSPQEKNFKLPEFDKLNRNTALARVLKHIASPQNQAVARQEFLRWAERRYDVVNSTAVLATFYERVFENIIKNLEVCSKNFQFEIKQHEILKAEETWLKPDRTPYGRVTYLYHLTYLIAKVQSLLVIAAEDKTGIATWSKSANDYKYASDKAHECLAETRLLEKRIDYLIDWINRIRSDREIPCDFNEPSNFDWSLLDLKQELVLQQPISSMNRTFASNELFANTIWNNWCKTHANCDSGLQNLHNTHPGRLIHAVIREQYEYHQQCVHFYKTRISAAWNIATLSQTVQNNQVAKKILDVIDQLLIDWHKAFEHSRFMAKLVSGSVLEQPHSPDPQLDVSTLQDEMQRYLQHAKFLESTQFPLLDFLDHHKLTLNASVRPCVPGSPNWYWAAYLNCEFKTFSAQLAISNLWADRTFLAYEIIQSIKAAEARLDPICLAYAKTFVDNCANKFQGLLEAIARIRADFSTYLTIFEESLEKMRISFNTTKQLSTSTDQALLTQLEQRVNYFNFIDRQPLSLSSDEASLEPTPIKTKEPQLKAINLNQDNLDRYVMHFKKHASNNTDSTFDFANAEILFGPNHSQFSRYYRKNAIEIRKILWNIYELHEKNNWPHMAGTAGLSFQLAHRLPGRALNLHNKVEAFLNPQYETSSTRQLLREIAQLSNWSQLKLLHYKTSSNAEKIREKAREEDRRSFVDLYKYTLETQELFDGINTSNSPQIFPSISRIKGEFSIRHILLNIYNFGFIVNYFLEVLAQRELDIHQLLNLDQEISKQTSWIKKSPNTKFGLVCPKELRQDFDLQKETVDWANEVSKRLKRKIVDLNDFLALNFDSIPGLGPDEIFRLWHHVLKPDYIANSKSIPDEYPPALTTATEFLLKKNSMSNPSKVLAGKDVGTILSGLKAALEKTLETFTAKEKNVDKINAIKLEAIQQIQNYALQRAAKEGLYPTSPNRLVFPITPSKTQGPTFTVT